MIPKILIIDDEEHMCWALERAMIQEGYRAISTQSGGHGLELLRAEAPSLAILDLKMPGMNGLEVLQRIRDIAPKMPVIMITAHGSVETAVNAMKMGATDYITKPFDLDELKIVVKQALKVSRMATEITFLRSELTKKNNKMIGESRAMKEVVRLINQVAKTNASVLITGESGTGKEVAAVAIHKASHRSGKPFVPVNCAALPEQLLESELFGHEKGAFTGAVARKLGRFQLADKGTILLDEIGEMSLNMQAKLLRVLQDKTFERVGGVDTHQVDVRIISATNKNILKAIDEGTFREDLYYRLNVVNIHLQPLRERKGDIPLLVEHFMNMFYRTYFVDRVSKEALDLLENYEWPGNIRELRNVIERAMIICRGREILPEHLPREIQGATQSNGSLLFDFPDSGLSLDVVERDLISKALEKAGGNKTKAAKLLGITRSTLNYRMQKYGVS